jgi:hypothetical protein
MWFETKGSYASRQSVFFKRTLLLFWAVWLTLVCTTNVTDGAKALGQLPSSWKFASGNYDFLVKTTARYHPPDWANQVLFVGVICWEAATALLFWRAWWLYRGRADDSLAAVYVASTVGMALWGAFIIADEVFITYTVAATHWRLLIAQLVTLGVIECLPEDKNPSGQT